MPHFTKVTIIGVGLIGGSIGLAIKKRKLAAEVVGVFRRPSTLKKALKKKAIDCGSLKISAGVAGADLIIVATPVHLIPHMVREAARFAKKGAIITDAGSTKEWIIALVGREGVLPDGVTFVGSHPMAGSEHTSVDYARADLFEGASCIVTPDSRTPAKAVAVVSAFWKKIGGRVSVLSPARHDASVSMISHLPHAAAFALAGAVDARDLAYAAEGFKDTTRVASSDPALWADIFLTNRREMLKAGKKFAASFMAIITAIAKHDRRSLTNHLTRAKARRDQFEA